MKHLITFIPLFYLSTLFIACEENYLPVTDDDADRRYEQRKLRSEQKEKEILLQRAKIALRSAGEPEMEIFDNSSSRVEGD